MLNYITNQFYIQIIHLTLAGMHGSSKRKSIHFNQMFTQNKENSAIIFRNIYPYTIQGHKNLGFCNSEL